MINISRSKGNQAIKVGQLIEYDVRNIFFPQKSWRKWTGRLVPDLVIEGQSKHLRFNILVDLHLSTIKTNYNISDCWSRVKLLKGIGLATSPHLLYDFSGKIFFMFNSINWPKFIAWLLFLGYWTISLM